MIAESPSSNQTAAARRILIVEDNELNMKLFRDLLEAHGYDTLQTKDGIEALKIARAHVPDLILMDIQLPGMSGIEALNALRADPATAALPVVAITASVMQQDRQEIMRAGFDGFIEKPINLHGLLDTVQKTMRPGKS